MIIDIHMHLGNILERGGGALIGQTAAYPHVELLRLDDLFRYEQNPMTTLVSKHMGERVKREEQRRNAAATLANAQAMLEEAAAWDKQRGGDGCVSAYVQPIAPHVTFWDLLAALTHEPRLHPFGSPDFSLSIDETITDLERQAQAGAWGLKIHPIIQCVQLDSPAVRAALACWQQAAPGKPVLFHTGCSSYYPTHQRHRERPEYSDPLAAARLIADFPQVPVILGHAGLFELQTWADCARFDHVYVDGSFQGPRQWKELWRIYGEHRLLHASDWPYGRAVTALRSVSAGLKGEDLERVLWRNAAGLLCI